MSASSNFFLFALCVLFCTVFMFAMATDDDFVAPQYRVAFASLEEEMLVKREAMRKFYATLDEDYELFGPKSNETKLQLTGTFQVWNTYRVRRPLRPFPVRMGYISHEGLIAKTTNSTGLEQWWVYEFAPAKDEGVTLIGPGKVHAYPIHTPTDEHLEKLYAGHDIPLVPLDPNYIPTYTTWKKYSTKNIENTYNADEMLSTMQKLLTMKDEHTHSFLYHVFYQNCHTSIENLYDHLF